MKIKVYATRTYSHWCIEICIYVYTVYLKKWLFIAVDCFNIKNGWPSFLFQLNYGQLIDVACGFDINFIFLEISGFINSVSISNSNSSKFC